MSKTVQNKKTANFIIACGYCLVVVVILINYLIKPPTKNQFREGTRPAHQKNAALDKAGNDLESQLNETKRMNREMREMLLDIQNAKSANNRTKTASLRNTSSTANTPREALRPVPVLDMNSIKLPELNSKIDEKFKTNETCPYIIGRNPFASPVVVTDVSDTEEPITFPGHAVISNPKLPYVFSGSNSNLRIISNY